MKFILSSLALVGVASASYYNNYECTSVDKRATNYWCQTNCLSLDGAFNSHPACFIDYRDRSVHSVCQCEEYQYYAHRETEKEEKVKVGKYEKEEKMPKEKYEEDSYECISVDPRSTDKWCK
eukprot:Awhi_evm1s720